MTTKSGRKFKVPTDEEDAKITAAAESDPDARPWTGEELAQVKQVQRGRPESGNMAEATPDIDTSTTPFKLFR